MSFHLRLERFEGPLEKLLELIESQKLEINEIALAEVTEGFLKYLDSIREELQAGGEEELRLLADFVVVASRLVLIKSKTLLPELPLTGDEECEIKDLTSRLTLYREFKKAEKHLAAQWKGAHLWARPYFLHASSLPAVFFPPTNAGIEALHASIAKLLGELERFMKEGEKVKDIIISLEEKMQEVLRRMKETVESRFTELSAKRSRSEVIALFLAILHLAREQLVLLEQKGHLSDIIIRSSSAKATE